MEVFPVDFNSVLCPKNLIKRKLNNHLFSGFNSSIFLAPSHHMLTTTKCHVKHSLKANQVFENSEPSAYNVLSLQLGKLASKPNAKIISRIFTFSIRPAGQSNPGQVTSTLVHHPAEPLEREQEGEYGVGTLAPFSLHSQSLWFWVG